MLRYVDQNGRLAETHKPPSHIHSRGLLRTRLGVSLHLSVHACSKQAEDSQPQTNGDSRESLMDRGVGLGGINHTTFSGLVIWLYMTQSLALTWICLHTQYCPVNVPLLWRLYSSTYAPVISCCIHTHPELGRGIQQDKIPVKVKGANISVHVYSWQEPDRILMKSEFQCMRERGSTDWIIKKELLVKFYHGW